MFSLHHTNRAKDKATVGRIFPDGRKGVHDDGGSQENGAPSIIDTALFAFLSCLLSFLPSSFIPSLFIYFLPFIPFFPFIPFLPSCLLSFSSFIHRFFLPPLIPFFLLSTLPFLFPLPFLPSPCKHTMFNQAETQGRTMDYEGDWKDTRYTNATVIVKVPSFLPCFPSFCL